MYQLEVFGATKGEKMFFEDLHFLGYVCNAV
jgi:hypothetical protein